MQKIKVVLLAAGYGSRLGNISKITPKCLVSIAGRPLLEIWLEKLVENCLNEILVNTHHLSHHVERFIDSSKYKSFVKIKHEKNLLGTAGTLFSCKEFIGSDTCMLIHADNLSNFNIADFLSAHKNRPKQCQMTMMTFQPQNPSDCGIVTIDSQNVVIGFEEKPIQPKSQIANAAIYLIEPSVIEEFYQSGFTDFSTQLIPKMLGRTYAYFNNIYHRDIGNPESLYMANLEWK